MAVRLELAEDDKRLRIILEGDEQPADG